MMKIVIFKTLRDSRTGLPLMMEKSDEEPAVFPITGRPLQPGEAIRSLARESAQNLIASLEADKKGLPSVM